MQAHCSPSVEPLEGTSLLCVQHPQCASVPHKVALTHVCTLTVSNARLVQCGEYSLSGICEHKQTGLYHVIVDHVIGEV